MPTKICPACLFSKDLNEFGNITHRGKAAKDAYCRPCRVFKVIESRKRLHPPKNLSVEDRFWKKVAICEHGNPCKTCCWLWIAAKMKFNYGSFSLNGKVMTAHRASYILAHGAIDDALQVCHDCPGEHNPRCVNPSHLYAGTPTDNSRDRSLAWHTPSSLQYEDVQYIRSMKGISTTKVLAERLHVSVWIIRNIWNRKTFRFIPWPI